MSKLTNRIKRYIRNKIGQSVVINVSQINYGGDILKEKKALITGGSSGIGFAIAKKYVSEGSRVVITGRNAGKLIEAQLKIGKERCDILEWDISNLSICKDKVQKSIEILKGIDILVNNAGVYIDRPFLDITENDFDTVMNIDSKGQYFIAQAVSEYYIQNAVHGKIINIASNRGILGDYGPYGMAKWGIIGLTKGLGRDLISKGIIVNGIAPGITATNINHIDVNENAYSDEPKNKRVGLPEEIAEIATFLASDAANNIIGQIIVCDGGTSLK